VALPQFDRGRTRGRERGDEGPEKRNTEKESREKAPRGLQFLNHEGKQKGVRANSIQRRRLNSSQESVERMGILFGETWEKLSVGGGG